MTDPRPDNTPPLLRVRDLRVTFPSRDGATTPVDGVSFDLQRGETLALVGESGCGKSLTALSLVKLLPPPGRIDPGSVIEIKGKSVPSLTEAELRAVRGRVVGFVFQDPMTSLNPVFTVEDQITEGTLAHFKTFSSWSVFQVNRAS